MLVRTNIYGINKEETIITTDYNSDENENPLQPDVTKSKLSSKIFYELT